MSDRPMPTIESVLIDRPGLDAMGAGETAITIVAAAVGNAIFDATGVRIRETPFTPERVKRRAPGARPRIALRLLRSAGGPPAAVRSLLNTGICRAGPVRPAFFVTNARGLVMTRTVKLIALLVAFASVSPIGAQTSLCQSTAARPHFF